MKVSVFYYTQSGQSLEAVKRVCAPLEQRGDAVRYVPIEPVDPFPFPWGNASTFFQAFPESRLLLPAPIKPIDFSADADADLVMIAGQSWYLSPSQPIEAFLQNEGARAFLKGKKVVFVNACRNMWAMTFKEVRLQLKSMGADFVGHIVLQDRYPNLVSVVTIVRWLIYGRKAAEGLFPAAGVSDVEIQEASKFGEVIADVSANDDWDNLQPRLVAKGGSPYRSALVFMERTGHRIFGIWAPLIRKKGGPGSKEREDRLKAFEWYLYFVLFVASPFGLCVYYLTYIFRLWKIKKEKADLTNVKG